MDTMVWWNDAGDGDDEGTRLSVDDRWAWRAWFAGWVALVVLGLVAFVLGVVGTLTNSDRLGYTEFPVAGLGVAIAMGLVAVYVLSGEKVPPRGEGTRLSREGRRELRRERERIELARRIEELERETSE